MVPPVSDRVPPAPPYSGTGSGSDTFRVRGCHPLRPAFPGVFRYASFFHFSPALQPRARLDARGLGWSPFARRYSGSHCCFPFLRLLRCFSSAGWPPILGCHASSVTGSPIRASADHGPFAPPRGFSQPAAPFFASGSQGIPRAPSGTCRAPKRQSRRLAARDTSSILALLELVCLVFLSFHTVKEPRPRGLPPDHVESKGFEPLTPGLQSRCSGQLS